VTEEDAAMVEGIGAEDSFSPVATTDDSAASTEGLAPSLLFSSSALPAAVASLLKFPTIILPRLLLDRFLEKYLGMSADCGGEEAAGECDSFASSTRGEVRLVNDAGCMCSKKAEYTGAAPSCVVETSAPLRGEKEGEAAT
jgi:hypothetical protein